MTNSTAKERSMKDIKEIIKRTMMLTNAIRDYKILNIEYNGVKRVIYPAEIKGDVVKAYQIESPDAKEGWRNFKIERVEELFVSEASFDPGFSVHFKKF